jgi:peptidoglycan/xylan/chitin deacetylase (PgdA/CDA1 family)
MLKALRQEDRDDWVSALEDAAGCRVADAATVCDLYEPLPWREAAEMAASGLVTFGSHTHTHVILSRCDPARAAAELTTSRRIIENRLGRPCDLFCYPNGRRGDFNDTTRELLKAQGFSGALTTVYGKNRPDADPYTLRRYNLGKRLLPGEMRVRLSGLLG